MTIDAPTTDHDAATSSLTRAAIVVSTSPDDNLSRVDRGLGTAQEFWDLLDDDRCHASLRTLVDAGFQVIAF